MEALHSVGSANGEDRRAPWKRAYAGRNLPAASLLFLSIVAGCSGLSEPEHGTEVAPTAASTVQALVKGPRAPITIPTFPPPPYTGAPGATCALNEVSCEGLCTDPTLDPHNCGLCGYNCARGTLCIGGGCTPPFAGDTTDTTTWRPATVTRCPLGFDDCGTGCIDVRSTNEHCGGCASPCPIDTVCVLGRCM